MITKKMNKYFLVILVFVMQGCSLAPGMHMEKDSTWVNDNSYVFIPSLNKQIEILSIDDYLSSSYENIYTYKIGIGDQIAVTVWGLPDIFPVRNLSPDQNLRRVDSNGNVFFPYSGLIQAKGKTQDQLRIDLTDSLSKYFNEPQVDVTIAEFNSQQIFILGEVLRPSRINISDVPISLSDAIGIAKGLNSNTASGSDVFIIRQVELDGSPAIFHADLQSPSGFISANKFYLENNDIVYVNSSGTARWNKVISQFFPFSSFLNSIDNLTED